MIFGPGEDNYGRDEAERVAFNKFIRSLLMEELHTPPETSFNVYSVREEAPNQLGRKFDQNKTRWDLMPFEVLELIAQVLTDGAIKYEDHNWKHVPDAKNRYFAAMMRHIVAYKNGERFDESGKSHLAHAASCLLFLMYFTEIENGE